MSVCRRALVVDDSADGSEAVCELLRCWGFDVEAANDGKQAREMVLTSEPDIIITDLSLPDGDALEFIAEAKARRGDRMFIIAYSGWHHLQAAARAAGADVFVLKPEVVELERLIIPRTAPSERASRRA
jgi:CheY-like chemotaxis protein